ncbi:hypothetical protein LTR78_005113 [Recurvomyces mirabilis]|uniref:Inositol oxygenase n=1 Tax=Recurvomyces mirabilis TaxID=574656 RepID=A0AAE1C291_9PEZI|nr:hypothetical protein LTR78_005113 [Recurvomyces mirabilis]
MLGTREKVNIHTHLFATSYNDSEYHIMAPIALETPNVNENFNDHRDGLALEATSDAVDEVNVLRAEMRVKNGTATQEEVDIYERSKFDAEKDKAQFRQYEDACDRVKNFYREQHEKQTVAYNLKARNDFKANTRAEMTIWQAMEKLNTLIDESDPDTSLSQIEHLLQSAEAIRRDGKPEWFQVTGLVHDLGKLLFFYDSQGQWDVVGDTFPVGCRFDESIIYPGTFENNPDSKDPIYSAQHGIYTPGCGLDNVMLSWGHDEYLYHICKEQSTLPDEALAMIRYHSFYPWHSAGGYRWMMNEKDEKMLKAVKAFNPYDLYSKSDEMPKIEDLKEYYMGLINTYFAPREGETERVIRW